MSPLELKEAKRQIQDMFGHGFNISSDSPYCAPVLFVPQKNGSLQFCRYCQWLKKKTIKNKYPFLLLQQLFNCLRSTRVFNKIDL